MLGVRLYLWCLFFLVLSCKNQEIQLPLIEMAGASEIQNHSSIWIFYNSENNKVKSRLNKNNKIINTHWIFNIDRRLPMKEVVPHLIDMQKDKNKDSMHKKEGMLNYFSYADTANETISLCLFRQTLFLNLSADDSAFRKIDTLDLPELKLSGDYLYLNGNSIDLTRLNKELENIQPVDSSLKVMVQLFIEEETTYQNYLRTKVYLDAHDIPSHSTEYLIN